MSTYNYAKKNSIFASKKSKTSANPISMELNRIVEAELMEKVNNDGALTKLSFEAVSEKQEKASTFWGTAKTIILFSWFLFK